jgi:ABC-type multidrug transport system fused ATPase/permease subunit
VILPAILLGAALDKALELERGDASRDEVTIAVLLLIAGTLLTEGPRVLKRWWLMTANARIRANIRADALRGMLSRPLADLHRISIGEHMARIVGDVEVLGVGVREFTIETWDTLLFSLSFVVALLVIDARLTLLALAPVPIAMLIAHAAGRWVAMRTTRAREANAALTARIQELLAGSRVLRCFGRQQSATAEIDGYAHAFARQNLSALRLRLGLTPVYSTLMMSGVVVVIWMGGERVINGALTVGGFVAYLTLFIRFVERGFRIPQLFNSIQSGGAAYARIAPMLAPALDTRDEPRYSSFDPNHVGGLTTAPQSAASSSRGGAVGVSIKALDFSYPGAKQRALTDLNLEIAPGSLVAVTGPIGAGKSALARALLGIYPLDAGTMRWHDADGSAIERSNARLSYAPQESLLFSGTIAENVLLAARPDPAVHPGDALEIAALMDDVNGFDRGVDTLIGELGVRISGGQRQRLCIARAIAAHAPSVPGLLILDDPFSAIDVETEARVIMHLREAFGREAPPEQRATIVLCSQRLAAFPQADHIVVLNEGRVVEQGTHASLLAENALYARIFRAQAVSQGIDPRMST